MELNQIQTEIDKALAELLQLISSIDQAKINVVPFEDSWTAGRLAQHVMMSCSGFVEMMNGPVKETERKPDEMVERIKSTFLDFSTRMKSPDFIEPPDTSYNKEDLIHLLEVIKSKIDDGIKTLDLTKTCLAFELPVLGFLTRLEALNFVLYHTQRHIHQLKKIRQKLVEPAEVNL